MFNLSLMISQVAHEQPDKTALISEGGSISYSTLDRAVEECSLGLVASGLQAGQSVGLQLENSSDFVVAFYGALRAGLVIVPFNPLAVEREINHILTTAQCRVLVTHGKNGDALRAAEESQLDFIAFAGGEDAETSAEVETDKLPVTTLNSIREKGAARVHEVEKLIPVTQADDVATLVFTSGTTGVPKAAQLTHFNLWTNCTTLSRAGDPQPSDVVLGCLPLFHVFGMTNAMNTAMAWGMTLILLPRFSAEEALRQISVHQVTRFSAVPTMINDMLEVLDAQNPDTETYRLETVKRVTVGGSALPKKHIEVFESHFDSAELLEGYGSSETTSSVCLTPSSAERRLGSVGVPAWGTQMRVVDRDGRVLPRGMDSLGELQVTGPTIFAGYRGAPEDTEEAFDGKWLRTGDIAAIDEDGFVYIKDRMKNLIIRGGYNVYAAEVENVLSAHPAIKEAVVVGIPDERVGQEIVAAVTAAEGQGVWWSEVLEFIRPRLSRYKQPRRLTVVGELPRNATGKIRRNEVASVFDGPQRDLL